MSCSLVVGLDRGALRFAIGPRSGSLSGALAMPHHLERFETPLRWVSALVGLCAAGLWFWSAYVPIPLAPGAAIGGTLPTDPFNEAIHQSAGLNRWAALITGLSVLFTVAAECVGLLARRS
jgi:hypothetical protein